MMMMLSVSYRLIVSVNTRNAIRCGCDGYIMRCLQIREITIQVCEQWNNNERGREREMKMDRPKSFVVFARSSSIDRDCRFADDDEWRVASRALFVVTVLELYTLTDRKSGARQNFEREATMCETMGQIHRRLANGQQIALPPIIRGTIDIMTFEQPAVVLGKGGGGDDDGVEASDGNNRRRQNGEQRRQQHQPLVWKTGRRRKRRDEVGASHFSSSAASSSSRRNAVPGAKAIATTKKNVFVALGSILVLAAFSLAVSSAYGRMLDFVRRQVMMSSDSSSVRLEDVDVVEDDSVLLSPDAYNASLYLPFDTVGTKNKQNGKEKTARRTIPRLALLLAYPSSGASATLANAQTASQRTVATSYVGDFKNEPFPLTLLRYVKSPFILNASLPLPDTVLTKSHCIPWSQTSVPYSDVHRFALSCMTQTRYKENLSLDRTTDTTNNSTGNATNTTTTAPQQQLQLILDRYPPQMIRKAVHLIRSPFHNVIARMHRKVREMRKKRELSRFRLSRFRDTKKGYKNWCGFLDRINGRDPTLYTNLSEHYGVSEITAKAVMCHSEWFRYVRWHNLAVETLQRLRKPVHVVYFEDYASDLNRTTSDLLNFLDLERVQDPDPFVPRGNYSRMFDARASIRAMKFVQKIASPACWKLLKRYFEPFRTTSTANRNSTNTTTMVEIVNSTSVLAAAVANGMATATTSSSISNVTSM